MNADDTDKNMDSQIERNGGIEIWLDTDIPHDQRGSACFSCHEALGLRGAVTDRPFRRNFICIHCITQWKKSPSRMLFEIQRHRKLPKGQLITSLKNEPGK
jgi:hypothetical protein